MKNNINTKNGILDWGVPTAITFSIATQLILNSGSWETLLTWD
ncbi:MAG: hypothetical protein ACEPOZ_15575 [Marinifilaceae bacterium]|jgi:hypothetical protein